MLVKYIGFIIIFHLCITAHSQHCGTDEAHNQKLLNYSPFEKNRKTLEDAIANISTKELRGDTIIIPVVFHIFHNGDSIGVQENITDNLIFDQIEQINNDFARLNIDRSQTPAPFIPLATDTKIRFCIANIAPDGGFTTGIIRSHINTLSGVSENDCWTTEYIDQNFVNPTIWDSEKYLNIYSLLSIDKMRATTCDYFSILGYAQFPGGNPMTDAIVTSFFTIGSESMPNPIQPQFIGRTLTHEIGHWLNLEHPWGTVGNCTLDDNIADTPNQVGRVFNCPSFPMFDNCTTSGDGIMFNNYMQFTDDNCMNMFSIGQSDLMRSTIALARPTLLVSKCSSSVLSISHNSNLTAVTKNLHNLIEWSLEDLNTIDKIQLEHSTSLDELAVITSNKIQGNTITKYFDFLHKDPGAGIHYYRLVTHYINGKISYSDIVSVLRSEESIRLASNPVNQVLEIIPFENINLSSIRIIDINGRLVLNQQQLDNTTKIDVSNYASGVYILQIKTSLDLHTFKWVKS